MNNLSTKGKRHWDLEQLRLTLLLAGFPNRARKVPYGSKLILSEKVYVTVYKTGTAYIQGNIKASFFDKLVSIVFGQEDYRKLKPT